jgi:hypothetical protein
MLKAARARRQDTAAMRRRHHGTGCGGAEVFWGGWLASASESRCGAISPGVGAGRARCNCSTWLDRCSARACHMATAAAVRTSSVCVSASNFASNGASTCIAGALCTPSRVGTALGNALSSTRQAGPLGVCTCTARRSPRRIRRRTRVRTDAELCSGLGNR